MHENGNLSLTRCMAVASFAAFLLVSGWLAYHGTEWRNYETFATLAMGGAVTQVVNKFINSKYNSPPGEP